MKKASGSPEPGNYFESEEELLAGLDSVASGLDSVFVSAAGVEADSLPAAGLVAPPLAPLA